MSTHAEQIEKFVKAHPGEWQAVGSPFVSGGAHDFPDGASLSTAAGYVVLMPGARGVVVNVSRHGHDAARVGQTSGADILARIAARIADACQIYEVSADTLPPWLADPVRWTLRTRAGELLTLAGSSPADVVSAAETVDEALCGRPVVEPTLSAMLAALQGIGMSCRWVADLPPDEDRSGDCDGPQAAHDYDEAYKAAAEYYDLLALLPDADRAEVDRLKARMDDLLAPTNDNPAYVVHQSFLRQKRLVTESLSERIVRARAEILRLDGVVTPEIMGEVLWNLRRVLGVT